MLCAYMYTRMLMYENDDRPIDMHIEMWISGWAGLPETTRENQIYYLSLSLMFLFMGEVEGRGELFNASTRNPFGAS